MQNSPFTLGPASSEDVPTMLRLRVQLSADLARQGAASRPEAAGETGWQDAADRVIQSQLDSPGHRYCVDRGPEGDLFGWGRASLVQGLPGPGFPTGRMGVVQNLVVVPSARGQGEGRRITQNLIDWLGSAGAEVVDLLASSSAEHLYRSLGFQEPRQIPLRLLLDG